MSNSASEYSKWLSPVAICDCSRLHQICFRPARGSSTMTPLESLRRSLELPLVGWGRGHLPPVPHTFHAFSVSVSESSVLPIRQILRTLLSARFTSESLAIPPTNRLLDQVTELSITSVRTTAFFICAVWTVKVSVTSPRLKSALSIATSEQVVWTRFRRRWCLYNTTFNAQRSMFHHTFIIITGCVCINTIDLGL